MLSDDAGPLCSCGRPATANGRECPVHFRARLRSIRVDSSTFEAPPSKASYYDRESIEDMVGPDAEERLMDATDGLGAGHRAPDGRLMRKDRKTGEDVPISDRDLEKVYLGGPIVGEERGDGV